MSTSPINLNTGRSWLKKDRKRESDLRDTKVEEREEKLEESPKISRIS